MITVPQFRVEHIDVLQFLGASIAREFLVRMISATFQWCKERNRRVVVLAVLYDSF